MQKQDVAEFLESEDWKKAFSNGALTEGKKLAHGRLVTQASANILDTGDVELIGYVMDKSGHQHEAVVALWKEDGQFMLDTSCSCDQPVSYTHLTLPTNREV